MANSSRSSQLLKSQLPDCSPDIILESAPKTPCKTLVFESRNSVEASVGRSVGRFLIGVDRLLIVRLAVRVGGGAARALGVLAARGSMAVAVAHSLGGRRTFPVAARCVLGLVRRAGCSAPAARGGAGDKRARGSGAAEQA